MLSGGEALPRSVAEKLLGGRALWNLYGPTEATIWVSCARIDDPTVIGLGAALPGIGLHVLDDDLAPVAPGDRAAPPLGCRARPRLREPPRPHRRGVRARPAQRRPVLPDR